MFPNVGAPLFFLALHLHIVLCSSWKGNAWFGRQITAFAARAGAVLFCPAMY